MKGHDVVKEILGSLMWKEWRVAFGTRVDCSEAGRGAGGSAV